MTAIPVSRPARLAAAALSLAGDRPLTQVLLHSPAIRPALRSLIARERPEVAVAFCTAMARYTVEPPLAGIPWILDMVDVDSEKWRTMGQASGPVALIYRREARLLRAFERRAMSLASATTIVSERERAPARRRLPRGRRAWSCRTASTCRRSTRPDRRRRLRT